MDGDVQFTDLTTEFLASQYEAHPVMATAMGVHENDDKVDNFNRFAMRDDRDRVRAYLHAIDKISLADLGNANRLDYRLARSAVQATLFELEQQRWPERQPGAYSDILFQGLFQLVSREFADERTRALSLLGRLRAIPDALREVRSNLKKPPRSYIQQAIDGIAAADSFFTALLPAFVGVQADAGLKRALTEAGERAQAAFADYSAYLRDNLMPTAGEHAPLGKEHYDYQLRIRYQPDRDADSADALLAIAQEELEATRKELDELAEEIAPEKGWRDIEIEPAPELSSSDLIAAYRNEISRARAFMEENEIATVPESADLEIVETPGYARFLAPFAAYSGPAPFEERQLARFYVTPVPRNADAAAKVLWGHGHSAVTRPLMVLRETYPGKHLQALNVSRVSSGFRRHFANNNLFREGWVLYCEDLMWDKGFYEDPRIRLEQQKALLWRICRMIADISLHTREMPLDEAAALLHNETGIDEESARAEVHRILLTPTQAVTGIAGKREILGLRTELQRRQGPRFNLRRFHDQALGYGSVPPYLLRDVVLYVP